ncbi:MAG: hypothetical protein A2W04_06655 [Betaproteobacteria bacterium RBG_16_64_9]|nr:MAG: hypothetical protein A2W04_06655 [Betaproteobacteria bacterium RBG_16_64_9]
MEQNSMPVYRETRGDYLIEASAAHLEVGGKWQPRLTMTRQSSAAMLPKSQSFPGLTPLFETAKGAARYAADLGRTMADHGSPRLKI